MAHVYSDGFFSTVSETLVVKLRLELLSGVEEARRDAQPDVQALAASAHKILLMENTSSK